MSDMTPTDREQLAAAPLPPSAGGRSGRRAIRVVAPLLAAGMVFAGAVAFRSMRADPTTAHDVATASTPVPRNERIEQEWGVRFTGVRLLASSGVVDLRYTLLDPSKAERLHAPENGKEGLPTLRTDRGTVVPDAVMMHTRTALDEAGRGFDIVYGNARGALQVGGYVTIVMNDGLELANVPVIE